MAPGMAPSCVAILGGGFDPVHAGHVAIIEIIQRLLKPTQLRIIPTGLSKHKDAFHAEPAHRIAMLSLALQNLSSATQTDLVIDDQEIKRAEQGKISYSIDTLKNIRYEFGSAASLVLVLGADQLQQLQHWKNWGHLLDLAHIVAVTRPGFDLDSIDNLVAYEFTQHAGSLTELRNRPFGHTYLYSELNIDISSTRIRNELRTGKMAENMATNKLSLVLPDVLDYIQQHHLY